MEEPIVAEQGRTLLGRLRPFFLAVAVIGNARSEAWPLRGQRGEVSSGRAGSRRLGGRGVFTRRGDQALFRCGCMSTGERPRNVAWAWMEEVTWRPCASRIGVRNRME